jgi:hypothetical protein
MPACPFGDDQRGARQREQHADDLASMDRFLTRHERKQQYHERRERHDQRQVDRGGRYTSDIDRSAADEHAEETSHDDAERLAAQQSGLFPQRHHDDRQQTERDDAPAEECDRERRNASRDAARQDHVGDLRGGDQQKAEQAKHFARPAGGLSGFAHARISTCETEGILVTPQNIGLPSRRRTHSGLPRPAPSSR